MKLSSPSFYTSPLSRFCDEHLPGDFHFLDGDEVLLKYPSQGFTFARATRALRVIECKAPGEQIRRSQVDVLPVLATALKLAAEVGVLAPESGVFIVVGDYPYTAGAYVSQVLPASNSKAVGLRQLGPKHLTRAQLESFIRCREVAA